MSQRFTVSKSDGARSPSDIQGEVNQLFEGDEPPTCSAADGGDAACSEEVVVLKGEQSHHRLHSARFSCRQGASSAGFVPSCTR